MKKYTKLTGFELQTELKKQLKKSKPDKEKIQKLEQAIKKTKIKNKEFVKELSVSPFFKLAIAYIRKQRKMNELIINKDTKDEFLNLGLVLDSMQKILQTADKNDQLDMLNSFFNGETDVRKI